MQRPVDLGNTQHPAIKATEEEIEDFLNSVLWQDIKTSLEKLFSDAVNTLIAEDDPLRSAYIKGEVRALGSLLSGPEGTWEHGFMQSIVNLKQSQTHFEED